ncbi:nickel-responsive transcriptional regulator NikR [Siccirubricoccus sp. KC 17139]|uniref:Putative nickel-responsive regulator n=1 Tax=Siccirubricoccus soli TaxID=2899147 RepID=A0ABT1D9X9_9PROT|nr:nickel-responsive transcriptional regulator NikR [Siccirubricoccus soli]MCO6418733.1 nickel-responsive transcriptional regulator NikR [Siccirubricoccus soli]MCP2684868.1 nickel-responsive transcriptional regulator NikR [Siccirubricoccus soli]
MERITITIEEELLATVDALVARHGYASRSEAMRDLLRQAAAREAAPETPCIATLSYVYDHGVRDLPRRLAQAQHAHHDLSIASLHVHLDHAACLEVAVLRGASGAVRRFADEMTSQRGVRHHALHLVPARVEEARHDHGAGAHRHMHISA